MFGALTPWLGFFIWSKAWRCVKGRSDYQGSGDSGVNEAAWVWGRGCHVVRDKTTGETPGGLSSWNGEATNLCLLGGRGSIWVASQI